MISEKLKRLQASKRATILGVGPMSQNCVDALLEVSARCTIPPLLIASRRQVDADSFGGGYVNNWSTKTFCEYVRQRDKRSTVILARDHGGPWQSEAEKLANLSLREAMASAKESFSEDIHHGMQLIHIDTSVDIHGSMTMQDGLDRLFELYEYCIREARRANADIAIEIGTEEQSGHTNHHDELEDVLKEVQRFCVREKFEFPTFVVVQTGTRVMEMRNVGSFDSPVRVQDEIPPDIQLPRVVEVCSRFDVMLKAHNTDYLSDESLQWHPRLGIHAANVAPEFGVCETRELIRLLREAGLESEVDQFLSVSFQSMKWEKWMLDGTDASDEDRSIIAGHYVFSTPEVVEIKSRYDMTSSGRARPIDDRLRDAVRESISRYTRNFRLEKC